MTRRATPPASDPRARSRTQAGTAAAGAGSSGAGVPRDPARTLVLASASPRRRELLEQAGVPHEVMPAGIDEQSLPDESAREMTGRLAREKALAVARRLTGDAPRYVLGSDTTVALDGRVFGKPRDAEDAVRLLQALCGRTHVVITAIAVVDTRSLAVLERVVESRVSLRDAGDDELRAYVGTGEPFDKAGAYAIQGAGGRLVSRLEGSRTNVIGLPVEETLELLARAGFPLAEADR